MAVKTVKKYEDNSQGKMIATFVAVAIYAFVFIVFSQFTLNVTKKYPAEMVIEFLPESKPPKPIPQGVQSRTPEQKPVPAPPIINRTGNSAPESAKVAKSNQSTKPAPQPDSKPSELTDKGDVETKQPVQPKINNKALFQSTSEGEEDNDNPKNVSENSLYPGVGRETTETRTANTPIGPEHRQAITANLSGRSVVGSLPSPSYNSQNQGTVVVEIQVDQNGKVTNAKVRSQGTTVQDSKLWNAATEAAKKAVFNVKKDAPIFQIGTIVYQFRLQ
jgi:TonB family protein